MCYGFEFERTQYEYESPFCSNPRAVEAWLLANQRALLPLLTLPLDQALNLVPVK